MPEIKVAYKPYKFLGDNQDKRFLYLLGGAGSAKSWSIAQFLLFERLYKQAKVGILALRKTRTAVKISCWPLCLYWLERAKLKRDINKSDLTIYAPNGSFMRFGGMDTVFKLKSMEGVNYLWIEELCGKTHQDYFVKKEWMNLNLSIRAANKYGVNQLYHSFNPIDPVGNQWIKELTDEAETHKNRHGKHDSALCHLTHKDNPFLPQAERDQIEQLMSIDAEYDKIYRQGQWATPTGLIYSNWDIVEDMPEKYDERIWGLDFGYSSNPAALLEMRLVGDVDVYEKEHIYQAGLDNPQLIEKMRHIIGAGNTEMIIADCAEPKSIAEIKKAGFNILPCAKGPDSVRNGIKVVKSLKIHLLYDSENLINEKQTYKWRIDRDGRVLDEPIKLHDHLCDAERYALQKIKSRTKAGIILVSEQSDDEQSLIEKFENADDDDLWDDF